MAHFDINLQSPTFAQDFIDYLHKQDNLGELGYIADTEDGPTGPEYQISEYIHSELLHQSNFECLCHRLEGLAGYVDKGGRDKIVVALDADGKATPAFRALGEAMREIADYPVLDEDHYSMLRCEEAAEHGFDVYGDEIFEAWRAGELTKCAGWCGDPDVVPARDAQPDVKCCTETTGDVRAFLEGHAQCRYLDSDSCY